MQTSFQFVRIFGIIKPPILITELFNRLFIAFRSLVYMNSEDIALFGKIREVHISKVAAIVTLEQSAKMNLFKITTKNRDKCL